jgi:ribonucleoside-diphosphate reductase beta chain
MKYKAVDWNNLDDAFTLPFLEQNRKQIWFEDDVPVANDLNGWVTLTPAQKDVYKKVLGGLTLLDTVQGGEGMPLIALAVNPQSKQRATVLRQMGMMEDVHAKSYSRIFNTLCTKAENDEVHEWIVTHPILQKKAETVAHHYNSITNEESLYTAMVASVFLESFLFYSGFYYPLLLSGSGLMKHSGEIINLIIRDESIHGVYVGLLAQELYNTFDSGTQSKLKDNATKLLTNLMKYETDYALELYEPLGLANDVINFLKYNANKALMNLGFNPLYTGVDFNPVVLAGLDTESKTHDFFSNKGNSYVKALNVEDLTDDDFDFSTV